MSENQKPIPRGSQFGQNESLTIRLNGLIREYPKGIGIFQEFIQNADDAGASCVKIILDRRTFNNKLLPFDSMTELMGPALMIYNDRSFSKDDLTSIQKIGMGNKRQSSTKTGRFGLGFNSSYNVTDYPFFLTQDSINFFDPHCNVIGSATSNAPGWAWKLTEIWEDYPDLFLPFEILNLKKNQQSFTGTIFRLPLRTQEQAKSSEISHQPFLESDFDEFVEKFTPLGADMLIFLKHVTRISIYEIPQDTKELVEILDISTTNEVEVRERRDQINRYVSDDLTSMIDTLRNESTVPPVVSFQHKVRLKTKTFEEDQTWHIVSGLFIDDQGVIIDLIEKMKNAGEKAVPWAGAAARLSLKRSGAISESERELDRIFEGKVFCFLPLNIPSHLPVHLNGYFDLDSSRQSLTVDRKTLLGHDTTIRANWNTQLIDLCVGAAYAELLKSLAQVVGRSDINEFYKYWPDPKSNASEGLEGIPISLYKHITPFQVLRSANPQAEWSNFESLLFIKPNWQKALQGPFIADEIPIPEPPLPGNIVNGFELAGSERNFVTVEYLCKRLRIENDIDQPLSEVERPCLGKYEWIVSLLKFCLEDKPSPEVLMGVPLAMLSDDHLHTFGLFKSINVFLAEETERNIFAEFNNWFVNSDFAEECNLKPIPEVKLFQFNPAFMIANLGHLFGIPTEASSIKWDPKLSNLGNESRLCLVYEYLTLHITDVTKNADAIKKLYLVPDQFNRLWKFSLQKTPLLPPENFRDDLKQSLTRLGIPIVTGSQELITAIRNFQQKAGTYIFSFTARDIVDTVSDFAPEWELQYPLYNSEVHDPLLNYLSSQDARVNLSSNPDRLAKLKKLLLFPTSDGQLARASESDLYLPPSYDLPVGGAFHILNLGPDNLWKPLLKLMGVTELDVYLFIKNILLPNYKTYTSEIKYSCLQWIQINVRQAEIDQQSKTIAQNEKIIDLIATSDLILCTDGNYHPCRLIYDPRQESLIRSILGNDALFPDMKIYHDQERWLKFFDSDLMMASAPRASEIIKAVDQLTLEFADSGKLSTQNHLLDIFNYIVLPENWNKLSQESVDIQTIPGVTKLLFPEVLKRKKWLPVQREEKRLRGYAAYQIPINRLYQAEELFMISQAHLVASQVPFAIKTAEKEIARKLGFPEYPTLSLVVKHFDTVLNQWSNSDHGGIKEEVLEQSLKSIYAYFGNIKSPAELVEIKNHYSKKNCIWHPRKKIFVQPEYVFRDNVNYMEPWRTSIKSDDPSQDLGYANLGRKEEPQIQEFIEFLSEVEKEYLDLPLPDKFALQVVHVFRRMSPLLTDNKTNLLFPLLTQNNELLTYTKIYVADAPWFQDKIYEGAVNLLHANVPSELIKAIGIRQLSECVEEKLAKTPLPSNNKKLLDQCARLERLIRSKEFFAGVLRLIRAEKGATLTAELDWLQKIKIQAVQSITIDLLEVVEGNERIIGTGPANYFFDQETITIHLAPQKTNVMYTVLGQALNSQIVGFELRDTASLISILNCEPNEIDEILNELHVKASSENTSIQLPDYEFVEDEFFTQSIENDEQGLMNQTEKDNNMADLGFDITGDYPTENSMNLPQIFERGELGKSSRSPNKHSGESNEESQGFEENNRDGLENNTLDYSPTSRNSSFGIEGSNEEFTSTVPTGKDVPPPSGGNNGDELFVKDSNKAGQSTLRRENSFNGNKTYKYSSITRNDRIFSGVYVRHGQELTHEETESRKIEIGNKAVDRVIENEKRLGYQPKQMPHNNPGYDVEVYDCDGTTLLKYIEVKGINGPWGVGGISLSSTQYSFGERHREKFWLYVVENVFDDNNNQIFPIQNPTMYVTQYYFGHDWKTLAKMDDGISANKPAIGLLLFRKSDQTTGLIVEIKGTDKFRVISLQFDDGRLEENILFVPANMTVINPKEHR